MYLISSHTGTKIEQDDVIAIKSEHSFEDSNSDDSSIAEILIVDDCYFNILAVRLLLE